MFKQQQTTSQLKGIIINIWRLKQNWGALNPERVFSVAGFVAMIPTYLAIW